MKTKKPDYYKIDEIERKKADLNLIYGQRENGKSFAVKKRALLKFCEEPEKNQIIYLRRRQADLKDKGAVEQYFADTIRKIKLPAPFTEYNQVYSVGNRIFIAKLDEKGKYADPLPLGFKVALSEAERIKSRAYPEVSDIIFEEFAATSGEITNEIESFKSVLSTCTRGASSVRVWMIGNTISRLSCYFRELELTNIPKQKPGTIDTYFMDGFGTNEDGTPKQIKICVERCATSKDTNSALVFGRSAKIINGGEWYSEEQPKLPSDWDGSDIYTIVFDVLGFKYLAVLQCDNKTGALVWFISPKTTPIQKNTRIISDKISTDPLTTYGLRPLSQSEGEVFKLFNLNKVFFSDNLTGTEFKQAMKTFF